MDKNWLEINNTWKVITKIRLLTDSSTVRCISVSLPVYWLESCISISCFPFLAEIFAVNTELIFQFAETTDSSMSSSVEGEFHVPSQRKPVSLLRARCTKHTLTSSPSCSPPCDGCSLPWLPSQPGILYLQTQWGFSLLWSSHIEENYSYSCCWWKVN